MKEYTHWVQGVVTSCLCLVFDSSTLARFQFPVSGFAWSWRQKLRMRRKQGIGVTLRLKMGWKSTDWKTRFDFGHHRGKIFQKVNMNDPRYCCWTLRQDPCGYGLRCFEYYFGSGDLEGHRKKKSGYPQGSSRAEVPDRARGEC